MDSRRLLVSFLFGLALAVLFETGAANDWNYDDEGPDVWPDLYAACGGSAQSPIDIKQSCTIRRRFPRFVLSGNYHKKWAFTLANNGHGISATLANPNTTQLSVTGGGLQGTYKFVNFHFHWGQNYASGSEHRIDGEKYAAELHLVHQNTVTGSLAVLGFLIKSIRGEDDADDAASNMWRNYFAAGSELDDESDTGEVDLNLGLLVRDHLDKFWRYNGSLTTPLCTEGVTWTVFASPIRLYDENIERFRSEVLEHNARDPQPLNGRTVYRSFIRRNKAAKCTSCD